MRILLALTFAASALGSPTPDIGRSAAFFVGEWIYGKRRLLIAPKDFDRVVIRTDGKFESESTVRDACVTAVNHASSREAKDDLAGVCVLEMSLERYSLRVTMAGERSDCDLDYGGMYQRKRR